MIDRGRIAEILKGPESQILSDLPALLPNLTDSEVFDLFDLMEDTRYFEGRLPLRLQVYAQIALTATRNEIKLLALLRLQRRLGSRKDTPDMGEIPPDPLHFVDYLASKARELCPAEELANAVAALATATFAYRSGDLTVMHQSASRGLSAINTINNWTNPPLEPGPWDLVISETGHELTLIASNAAYRTGDIESAREIASNWSKSIENWEKVLGLLPRLRYLYFRLTGRLNFEVGLYEPALEAYSKALEYAPTPYRKAFIWLAEAQIERELGELDASWDHAINAIDAILNSPYPQTAAPWIEWLASDLDDPGKTSVVDNLRNRLEISGGLEINRVTSAMTSLYRTLTELHTTSNPASITPVLDQITLDLENSGSWPNLVTLLSTKAVVAGRLGDRDLMNQTIDKARTIITQKLTPDARPPAEFLLESAYALALRDVGDYDEAFNTLFERALEARKKYPGGVGPEEMSALEAVYYLGALAGYDPDTIERKIRDTINNIG